MSFKRIDQAIRNWNHKRIDYLRSLRLRITKCFFDNQSNLIAENQGERNILVFRLDDKLGDAVASTGFLNSVKKNYPDCKLIILAGPQTSEIYRGLSFVDDVLTCKKGFGSLLSAFSQLKKKSFKYVVNTSHILSPRVVMLLSLLRAEKKIGFLNGNYRVFSAVADYDANLDHVTTRYRHLAGLMKIQNPDLNYVLEIKPASVAKAQNALAAYKKSGKKIILINSFAGARLRNFSKDTTLKLVKGLIADGNNVVISVANSGDHRILNEWRSEFSNLTNWIQLTEFSSLEDNLALLSQSDLVITPDTAWVHLASAQRVNLVAVYREDTDEKNSLIWSPNHKNSKVVMAPNTPENPHDINNVSVEAVLNQAKALLF